MTPRMVKPRSWSKMEMSHRLFPPTGELLKVSAYCQPT